MSTLWATTLYVAAGSAVGGAARFLIAALVYQRYAPAFPVATLLINVSGSLILGVLLRWVTLGGSPLSANMIALLTTGFCGGFTTFSTFSFETARLLEDGDYRAAVLNVVLSVVLALAATFAGFVLAARYLAPRN